MNPRERTINQRWINRNDLYKDGIPSDGGTDHAAE
jgi:hypothetical protein